MVSGVTSVGFRPWLRADAGDRIERGGSGELYVATGESLEESPEVLRAAARPIAYGQREISGLSQEEADAFAQALDDA